MSDARSGIALRVKRIARKTLKVFGVVFAAYIAAIALAVWIAGDEYDSRLHETVVNDITQLNPVPMAGVVTPRSVDDIAAAIKGSSGPISIGGGRYSMGGQTAIDHGLQLDMREFRKVVAFDAGEREITVQPGITWREVQEHIDPYDLSVKIMQTYANFTVGGSLSVNVHGRYIGHGPIISSVKAIKLVLADGSLVTASRDENPELFFAAIGGYGGIGVIAEATLELVANTRVGRQTAVLPVTEYAAHFATAIRDNTDVVFHNADIYPPAFETVRDVSWYVTDEDLTIEERLIAIDETYWWLPKLLNFSNASGFGKWMRESVFEPVYYAFDRVAWRNWEASYDVRELGEGDRSKKTWVLQEYFIPVENFDSFVPKMRDIFTKHEVDVVNVSIRHALPDPDSYLSWARNEVFAFVVYHSQGTTAADKQAVGVWTREMIDAILSEGGAYYLPYQPHATVDQFRAAYPNADRYFAVKREVDPDNRFQNKLWEKYYPTKRSGIREYLDTLEGYVKGEEQTFLTVPEWYLVFNPNEYADFLASGNNPSDFPFWKSIDEYWTLYDRVNAQCEGLYPRNSEYQMMLWVIGVSTTAEFIAKGAYENTIGRLTRWTASDETPEDLLIREAHAAYGELINYEPWYEFPFAEYAGRIWSDTPFFGRNFIRKFERKLSFTAEFAFKALYAKAIGYASQSAYGPSQGRVTMHVVGDAWRIAETDGRLRILRDFGDGDFVITAPRWGGFTEIMPKLADAGTRYVEINGNDEIVFTTVEDDDVQTVPAHSRLLFNSMVISPTGKKRSVYVVRVEHLSDALRSLEAGNIELEHVFDY